MVGSNGRDIRDRRLLDRGVCGTRLRCFKNCLNRRLSLKGRTTLSAYKQDSSSRSGVIQAPQLQEYGVERVLVE